MGNALQRRAFMKLRKINAGLSLLTTVLFLNHAMFLAVCMLGRKIEDNVGNMPWVLVVTTVLHAGLSILFAILGHKGAEKRECKAYPKMNLSTYVQRASGIGMILLLIVHIAGAANHFKPKMFHAVLHPVFFAVSLAHIAVSVGKAMITLGIGNAKAVKIVDIIMKILCAATWIASVLGFYRCLFLGVVR